MLNYKSTPNTKTSLGALKYKAKAYTTRMAKIQGPKFNWIGLLPIQFNLFLNTHIKHSLNACEITKVPLIQKLV